MITQKLQTGGTPISHPAIEQTVTNRPASTGWHAWWYSHRQPQLQENINATKRNYYTNKYTKSLPTTAEEETERMLSSLETAKEYKGTDNLMDYEVPRKIVKRWATQYFGTDKDLDDDTALWAFSKNFKGAYDNDDHVILYPDQYENPESNALVHERTHALDPRYPVYKMKTMFTDEALHPEKYDSWWKVMFANRGYNSPSNPDPENEQYSSYLDNAEEIYSRLMSFRQAIQANPYHTWTKNDLNKYREELKNYQLDRYSDENILRFLNELASNTNAKTVQHAYTAKHGGTLNYFNFFK